MISKCLEKTIQLIPDELNNGINNAFKLEYYLVESENSEIHEYGPELDSESERVFGIEVVKRENSGKMESKLICNYSNSKKNAMDILNKMAENTVTPVSLPFVLDDLIGI